MRKAKSPGRCERSDRSSNCDVARSPTNEPKTPNQTHVPCTISIVPLCAVVYGTAVNCNRTVTLVGVLFSSQYSETCVYLLPACMHGITITFAYRMRITTISLYHPFNFNQEGTSRFNPLGHTEVGTPRHTRTTAVHARSCSLLAGRALFHTADVAWPVPAFSALFPHYRSRSPAPPRAAARRHRGIPSILPDARRSPRRKPDRSRPTRRPSHRHLMMNARAMWPCCAGRPSAAA
jgi:hypothetical protein